MGINADAAIRKLLNGIRLKHNQILLYDICQYWSEKYNEVSTVRRVSIVVPVAEYNARCAPGRRKKKDYPYETAPLLLKQSYSQRDILVYLSNMWNDLESGRLYAGTEDGQDGTGNGHDAGET